jgi:putative transposase
MFAMWNLPPPAGFQNFDRTKPVTWHNGVLPHLRQDGATYFVTFRLADSLPQSKLRELRAYRDEWNRQHPLPQSREQLDELAREMFTRIERWIDQGLGSCVLRDKAAAHCMADAMQHFAGDRYVLGAYVVMPNHVHAIVQPLHPAIHSLDSILGSWKQYASREINIQRQAPGPLWQEEGFDRVIRDAEHLYRVLQYIGRNPRNAGLSPNECLRWVNPLWQACGWIFEDA